MCLIFLHRDDEGFMIRTLIKSIETRYLSHIFRLLIRELPAGTCGYTQHCMSRQKHINRFFCAQSEMYFCFDLNHFDGNQLNFRK